MAMAMDMSCDFVNEVQVQREPSAPFLNGAQQNKSGIDV
jgi:hypothetical protein